MYEREAVFMLDPCPRVKECMTELPEADAYQVVTPGGTIGPVGARLQLSEAQHVHQSATEDDPLKR